MISETIQKILLNNLNQNDTVFVFPTSVDTDSWAEWIVFNTENKAVPKEKFLAWDKFKSICIVENPDKELSQIPSVLRKLFARSIAQKNIFKKIINPEYSDSSISFATWISNILPPLFSWKKYFDKYKLQSDFTVDDEDNDYLALYEEYEKFLKENSLFEPAWIEPQFSSSKNKYIIFFPEVLDDFADYKAVLESSESIQIVHVDEASKDTKDEKDVFFYTNSRTELHRTALKIRQLHSKKNVPWQDITINVPELETYRPYIERELSLYCIPFNTRAGTPLTKNCAGRIFREIRDCVNQDFSYDSVRALLLDGFIPWKNVEQNTMLVRQGSLSKCLFGFEVNNKKIDVWEKSLPDYKVSEDKDNGNVTGYNLKELYLNLKKTLNSIYSSKNFKDLRIQWFAFKEKYLVEDGFSLQSDLILGRCLSELNSLIEIEENFLEKPNCSIELDSPFMFFVSELENKTYQKQSVNEGVSIFPYKLSAASAYKYNFIINASQKAINVENRPLAFLSRKKRIAFKIEENSDCSKAFIKLYNKYNSTNTVFSVAERTFTTFAIAHSYFTKIKDTENLSDYDFIVNERNALLSSEEKSGLGETAESKEKSEASAASEIQSSNLSLKQISELQKKSFNYWYNTQLHSKKELTPFNEVSEEIKQALKNKLSPKDSLIHISATDLKSFYPYPRTWFLKSVLRLKEDTLDTDLLEIYDSGKIYHKLIELFLKFYKRIPTIEEFTQNEKDIKGFLLQNISTAFTECDAYNNQRNNSFLVKTVLDSESSIFVQKVFGFIKTLSENFGGWNVVCSEEQFFEKEIEQKYYYKGIVDCILSNEENIDLIDFKTGKAPSIKDCLSNEGELKDFQISEYLTLWNLKHQDIKIDSAMFYSLNENKFTKILKAESDLKQDQYQEHISHINDTLNVFKKYSDDFNLYITNTINNGTPLPINLDENSPFKKELLTLCKITYVANRLGITYEQTENE